MYLFITILALIVSLLLVLVVLVQNSKGGGLSSGFSSSNQFMGAPKTTDVLEKATWGLAGALLVLCIATSAFVKVGNTTSGSEITIEQPTQGFDINTTAPVEEVEGVQEIQVETPVEGSKIN